MLPILEYVDQYNDLIRDRSTFVIDCYAKWCGPCKVISPFYESLANKYKSITFFKLDVDESEELANLLNIEGMPTFLFYVKGKLYTKLVGVDKVKLENIVSNMV